MLCAAELCSLHFSFGSDAGQSIANALFADGAAALVAARCADSESSVWRLTANGSVLVPETAEAMTWRIGDRGFEMTLSAGIPSLIRSSLRGWLEAWLESRGISLREVASWAIHPGGPRILESVGLALGLRDSDQADSRAVFSSHGNMSSPTVMFILERLIARDAPRPCVALGFGPGMVIEAALFE